MKIKTTHKKTGGTVLVSDKSEFNTKNITWDKEGHLWRERGKYEQQIAIKKIYAPKKLLPKYRKQKLEEIKEKLIIQQ